ncbi:Mfa1 family fimbria major subunit [Bacteroides sp.]|uniref:Mfa1 family fimbria major subunit n=1 Tax=Bacteroides sp. TaxID=29523 RepID=UPI00262622ED|nr:Mfa1 family fimbria major subunit [Bacteroides sp.]MDD3038943.1 Mfa1 family fimbria major subunit [Bacteroides sp.]
MIPSQKEKIKIFRKKKNKIIIIQKKHQIMKLKSLFLVGIAAFAMTSCSNEVEGIDNSDNGTKDAIMQFGISFANSSNIGERDATAGGEDKGTASEQNFSDATIVIEQNGKKNIVNVLKNDFESQTSTTTTILWLKEKIAVNPGAANVWVFLNASSALKTALATPNADYKALKETASFTGNIKALEAEAGIAEENHFLMSNASGDAKEAVFTANITNPLTVDVSRVASKLEETTLLNNSYSVTDDAENLANVELTVKLTDFAYAGLQQEVSVLKGGTVTSNLFAPYNTTAVDGFIFQKFAAQMSNDVKTGSVNNYCMENLTGTSNETYTNVIYKGQISVDGATGTLYITSDNKAFKSVKAMKEAGYNFEGLTEETTIEDCWNNYALRKYDGGVCYYVAPIETANTGKQIVRNNIYRLNVKSIKGIGSVLPKEFSDPTLLDLTVGIQPWSVNENAFEL